MRQNHFSLRNLLYTLLIFVQSIFVSSQAISAQEFILINHPVYNPGMFCVLNMVVAMLHKYENQEYTGLQIDFENQGLYYDPEHGNNWWEYYFQPLKVGSDTEATIQTYAATDCVLDHFTQTNLNRKYVNRLIDKYIKLQPEVQSIIDRFLREKFKPRHFVIGIHYRGTDHYIEAPRVSYEDVVKSLNKQIKKLHGRKYQIFLATDEQEFLDYMISLYNDKVIHQNISRSSGTTGLHFQLQPPFESGLGALLDCLLLSKCHLLIRTDSRLSLWSTYFNPTFRVIELNRNYYLN